MADPVGFDEVRSVSPVSGAAEVWRAKCNKIGMKIRHTYVRIYGHAECAYTDLRLHYKDLPLSLHMQTYVYI